MSASVVAMAVTTTRASTAAAAAAVAGTAIAFSNGSWRDRCSGDTYYDAGGSYQGERHNKCWSCCHYNYDVTQH